jgi:hypothetical protein
MARPAPRRTVWLLPAILLCAPGAGPHAQVQIRVGDPSRTLYSEIHEALRDESPAADSVRRILEEHRSSRLWRLARQALEGATEWQVGQLALTRIAELHERASLDSVLAWRRLILDEQIPPPPATNLRELLPALRAIQLELDRDRIGDQAVLNDLLARIPSGRYDLGDAWVFGRLQAGAADSLVRRFLSTEDGALRVRYLTLLSFSADTSLIPFHARVFAAPDSFRIGPRLARRASDGLIWIGTRASVRALLDARARARARGIYADPSLGHADLDFLGNDSSMVVSRTGKWLTKWLDILPGD